MRLYTLSYFFNTFTPAYVGGDIARSYHLGKTLDSQRDAFVATFLERFTGLLAMALLGLLFVALGAEATAGLSAAIIVVGAGALFLTAILFVPQLGRLCFAWIRSLAQIILPRSRQTQVCRLLDRLDEGFNSARGKKRLLFDALLLSFFFHGLTVLNTYVAALTIGWSDPPIGGLFIVVPLVLLISMVPLTPSSLGVQEGAFLFLLLRVGATQAEGLAVGLVLRVKILILAIVGAIIWARLERDQQGSNTGASDAGANKSNASAQH